MENYRTNFSKKELHAALHANDSEATAIIQDEAEWNDFKKKIKKFLKKAKKIPVLGGMIDDIVCMVALVDSYMRKEYSNIPVGTIVAIVATLIYILSPIDIISDMIPFAGYLDDAAIVLFVLGSGVNKDLDKYRQWQEKNRKLALDNFEQIFAEELSKVINDGYLAAILLCESDMIKMLIALEQDSEMPVDCIVKEVKVPRRTLAEYEVETEKDIIGVIGETIVRKGIKWMHGSKKKVYLEPDFEEKWNDYIIQEGY